MTTILNISDSLSARVRRSLDRLPAQKRACAEALFQHAHRAAVDVLASNGSAASKGPHIESAHLVLAALDRAARAELEANAYRLPLVSSDGTIWGLLLYEELDVGWLTSAISWMLYENRAVSPFPTQPQTIRIPNRTTVALLGDWGGGAASPDGLRVGESVKRRRPEYTIHLGDVYYYGGLLGRERVNLVLPWPGAPGTSFALNSNHEMYAGAHGYFEVALGRRHPTPFTAQRGTSYFALENDHYVIVGLDSAYFSDWCDLYMSGRLDDGQLAFLAAQVQKDKRVIVLTHHHGLSLDGLDTTELWQQVVPLLPDGSYWYWGHLHSGVIYTPRPGARTGTTIHARCNGHGAIPHGVPRGLVARRDDPSPTVAWFEETPIVEGGLRVRNGYVLLTLDGEDLDEQFLDQEA